MNSKFEEKDRQALSYLNRKYGKYEDSFSIVNTDYSGYTSLKDTFYIKAKKMPKNLITLECIKGKYKDNYMVQRMIQEYQFWIKPIYSEILGMCNSFCSFNVHPTDKLQPGTTLETFIRSDACRLVENIIVTDIGCIDRIDNLMDKIRELQVPHRSVHLKVLSEAIKMTEITDIFSMNSYEKKSENPYQADVMLKISKDYEISSRKEGMFLA